MPAEPTFRAEAAIARWLVLAEDGCREADRMMARGGIVVSARHREVLDLFARIASATQAVLAAITAEE